MQWRIPEFPDGEGVATDRWVWENLLFGKILAENCMKIVIWWKQDSCTVVW